MIWLALLSPAQLTLDSETVVKNHQLQAEIDPLTLPTSGPIFTLGRLELRDIILTLSNLTSGHSHCHFSLDLGREVSPLFLSLNLHPPCHPIQVMRSEYFLCLSLTFNSFSNPLRSISLGTPLNFLTLELGS